MYLRLKEFPYSKNEGLFDVEIIMNSNKVVKRTKNGYLDIILNVSISDQ
jgi:hypothetical protein